MLIAYTYKLDPQKRQSVLMEQHVEMLRLQFNFRVRERTEAYEFLSRPVLGNYCDIKTQGECCPLSCSVSKNALYGDPWTSKGKKRSALAQQDADLPNLKRERPWYANIQHHVLQQMLRQVDNAFQRFFKGEGKYPKTKRRGKFRSFTYPPGDVRFQGNKAKPPQLPPLHGGRMAVRLPGIGWMHFYQSRPFPDGFAVRSVTVRRKTDGWFLSVRLQDDSVPTPISPSIVKTAIGVDLGIAKLASLSNGQTIPNPRFAQKVERKRKIKHRRASRKKTGSRNRHKACQSLARLENKVANQRIDHQWKIAKKLTASSTLR